MKALKKYLAILFLILAFPLFRFVANQFVLAPSNDIYAFVPQESDFVIEINTRNFVQEIMYQKLYHETYFNEKVYPVKKGEKPESRWVESGIDMFSKIVLFREQWANEAIWFAVIKHNGVDKLKSFILTQNQEAIFETNERFAIIQLTPSSNQESLSEHIKNLSNQEIKSFKERKNITSLFKNDKEINCFIIPKPSDHNDLLEGYFSFDFTDDKIVIDGEFTPISGLETFRPIAYELDNSKAMSLRSSLNLFNSIYWFDDKSIERVPEYSQLAMDYDGVLCQMIHKNQGYSTPFKSKPRLALHFDILKEGVWNQFFDSLTSNPTITVDTAAQLISTQEGASFNYRKTNRVFELMQDSIQLKKSNDEKVFFDFYLNPDWIIDRTEFTVHPEFPPSALEQNFGLAIAMDIMNQIKTIASMEFIDFQILSKDDQHINVTGEVVMKEKNGHSVVETLSFGTLLFKFIQSF